MTAPALSASRFSPRGGQPIENMIADAKGVLEGLFAQPDPNDLPPMARALKEMQDTVRAIASEKFSDEKGLMLLEALCDATIRKPVMVVIPGMSLEAAALLAAKREGQNEAIYMLLAMIAEGRGEQPQRREGT